MPSTSFSSLPTELIIQTFHSVDGFSTAAALSGVSHQINSIWKQILPSLCKTLLPRTVDCFDQAKELAEAQSRVADNKKPSDATGVAIERAKLLFANADMARVAYHSYKYRMFCGKRLDSHDMTAAERTSFVQSWYRAIAIATLGNDLEPLPYQMMISMNLFQFLQMMEVTSWLGRFRDHYNHEQLRPYITLIRGQGIKLYYLQYHLCEGMFHNRRRQIDPTHICEYILHDHYPESNYPETGVGLEQLFPKVPTVLIGGILKCTLFGN